MIGEEGLANPKPFAFEFFDLQSADYEIAPVLPAIQPGLNIRGLAPFRTVQVTLCYQRDLAGVGGLPKAGVRFVAISSKAGSGDGFNRVHRLHGLAGRGGKKDSRKARGSPTFSFNEGPDVHHPHRLSGSHPLDTGDSIIGQARLSRRILRFFPSGAVISGTVGHAENSVTLRAPPRSQGKAHCAGNGEPFSSSATRHWLLGGAPSGPLHKAHSRRCTRLN